MDSQATNVDFVWRKIWRRFWHDDYSTGGMTKSWRRVLRRVPANYSPPAYPAVPAPSTDPQSITYADCEAFFEAVTEDSREDLIKMLNIHGPEVITELSKSYNEHGETPLLVAIQRGNLDMVKFLIGKLDVPIGQIGRFLCGEVEYLEVPALYAAIVCGEMDIVAYLLSMEVTSNQTATMIDSIISSPNERQKKINILELMGAANFYFHESHPAPQNGLMYWREATNLRHSTIGGQPPIPKDVLPSDLADMNFGFASEFTTLEQLEELSTFQLFTQAISVSQRVLNIVSPGPHVFTLTFLCHCASVYSSRQGQRGHAVNILTFFLQQSQELQWKEFSKSKIINWALDIMLDIIIDSRQKRSINPGQEELIFANLMTTFDFATNYMSVLQENEEKIEFGTPISLANCILEMIFLLTEMMPQLNPQERQQFERSLSLFIRKDHRWGIANRNLLHTICDFSIQNEMPQDENDQWEFLIDNADIMGYGFDNDSNSDIGSGLGFNLGGESENDAGSDDGSDQWSDLDSEFDSDIGSDLESGDVNSDVFSDNGSMESDADNDSDGDLSDDLGNETDEHSRSSSEIDENQDIHRFPSWRNRYARSNCSKDTDVSGCPSCGHNGEMSSDEADNEDFELIRYHGEDEEMEIQNDDGDLFESSAEDLQLSVIQLILRLGADPNATDLHGYTPLHLLAMNRNSVAQSRMLLEYGAHIDQPDVSSSTPLMHFQEWQRQLANQGNPDLNLQFLISYALPLPLSCLAARVLSKNQISFDKEKIPAALHSFIQRH